MTALIVNPLVLSNADRTSAMAATAPLPVTAAPSAAEGPGAAATTAALECVDLTRKIDDRAIINALSFRVEAGSWVALLGANGAGKTTLLHTLALLTPATSGQLFLFGHLVRRSPPSLRARIGLIGHQPMLYRDLTALENLVFFGRLYGLPKPRARAAELLDMVKLADRAGDLAGTFSRGMVQRLAIARALMHDPDLLLADEPFSGLDLPSVESLERLLCRLHDAGKTIILSNHDIPQSLRLAQRVLVLRRGRIAISAAAQGVGAAAIAREVCA